MKPCIRLFTKDNLIYYNAVTVKKFLNSIDRYFFYLNTRTNNQMYFF